MTELRETKGRLREMVLARREALAPEYRVAFGRTILRDVAGLPAYREAATVLAYAGFGSELRTDDFLRHTLESGKTLLLPRVDRRSRRLEIHLVTDPERDLVAGTWGIREPDPERCPQADPRTVDFVLVPGVAFDARGVRLGYGAGFYDGLLAGGIPDRALFVAGAFETQMVEEVPHDDHDVPVDLVITETAHYPRIPPTR